MSYLIMWLEIKNLVQLESPLFKQSTGFLCTGGHYR